MENLSKEKEEALYGKKPSPAFKRELKKISQFLLIRVTVQQAA